MRSAAAIPIRRMVPVDAYGGSDFRSIEADNTSAFNCRFVDGTTRYSEHAYGRAIDVNPIENPYVTRGGTTSHPASRPYLRRTPFRPGMAVEGRALVRAFDAIGWGWGGRWSGAKDYQHFSASGRSRATGAPKQRLTLWRKPSRYFRHQSAVARGMGSR